MSIAAWIWREVFRVVARELSYFLTSLTATLGLVLVVAGLLHETAANKPAGTIDAKLERGEGGVYWLITKMNAGHWYPLVFDTGSATNALPRSMLESLGATNTGATRVIIYADGRKSIEPIYRVERLVIEGCVFRGVTFTGANDTSLPLLGLDLLKHMTPLSFDTSSSMLRFTCHEHDR